VQKRKGPFTGWIGYTLAWTERQFDALNNGKPFPPRYDRRHDISVVLNYNLSKRWEFTAVWVYGTGQAFTFPTAQYSLDPYPYEGYGSSSLLYSDRNGYRLPAYHRLDLNFSHLFRAWDMDWRLSLNLYNAYNHMNPFSRYVERKWSYDGPEWRVHQVTLFPILPTFGISFTF
jgi:hypothetical protein